jgi:hypothetical protein
LRSKLVRLAARLIVEEGLEGEATDALGRDYYGRGAAPGAGYRNGYRTGRLKTAEGVVEYAAPQISDRAVPFRSRLREIIRGRSEELEALAVEMYARGNKADLTVLEFISFGAHIWFWVWRRRHASNRANPGRQDVLLSSLRSTLFGDVLAAFQE